LEHYFEIERVSDTMIYIENNVLCQGQIPLRKSFYGQERKMTLSYSDSIFLYFTHQVSYPARERNYDEKNMIDRLRVSAFQKNDSGFDSISWLSMLTSNRGADVDSINSEFRNIECLQEYNFLNKNFKDVYGDPSYGMYFSKQFGVVSFKYYPPFGELVFDRFEY